jgi:acylaminoacyl-peptidase
VIVIEESLNDGLKGPEKFKLNEDWGEKFTKKKRPTLCLVDFVNQSSTVIPINPNISPAQPSLIEINNKLFILFVGTDELPRKYGIVYCFNRRSGIYLYDLIEKTTVKISQDGSFRSPVYKNDTIVRKSSLFDQIYLGNPVGGAHFQSTRIYKFNVIDNTTSVLQCKSQSDFPGLYLDRLSYKCVVGDNLFVSSFWKTDKV